MALRKCCVGGFLRVVCQSHAVPDLVAKAVVAKSTALLDNTQSEAAAEGVEIRHTTAVKAANEEDSSVRRIAKFCCSRVAALHPPERSQSDQSVVGVVDGGLLGTQPHHLQGHVAVHVTLVGLRQHLVDVQKCNIEHSQLFETLLPIQCGHLVDKPIDISGESSKGGREVEHHGVRRLRCVVCLDQQRGGAV